ncbi:hypothetical protein [Salinimicrobium terrae]|uniref:hypothetical protein n=1 Tax=Salinimicrobium terrae TaxID=470866 RepID=UPI000427E68D|nr:hypothetical protein [Salinimicrobium terrae]
MKNGVFDLFLVLIFLLNSGRGNAQEGINVTAGIGLPEMLNLGLRMQFERTQIGIAFGTVPGSDSNFTISSDFYYHFGGRSELTSIQPWFFKTGLTYMSTENEWRRETSFLIVPRIGREFNISSKFGVALEAGFLVILSEHEKVKKENPSTYFGDFDLDFTGLVLPSAGLNIFYRF